MAEGTYTFTVKEDNGGLPGITYDDDEHLIVVTVTDVMGSLAITVTVDGKPFDLSSEDGFWFIHENIYSTSQVSVPVYAFKDLEGATLVDNQFQFVLRNEVEGTAPEPNQEDGGRNRNNQANGDIRWDIVFRETGRFVYEMYEMDDGVSGIVYDETRYRVVVQIERDPDSGALEPTVEYYKQIVNEDPEDGERTVVYELIDGVPVFTNWAYVDQSLTMGKVVSGRDWLDTDNFTFKAELVNVKLNDPNLAGGDPSEYVTSLDFENVDGPMYFTFNKETQTITSTLRFFAAGEFTFKITELSGNVSDLGYDLSEYTVTVTVRDAISRLSSSISIAKDGALYDDDGNRYTAVEFTNVYGTANTPLKPTGRPASSGTAPGTGDDSHISLLVGLMVLSLAGLLTVIPLSRKMKLLSSKGRQVK